MTARQGMGRGMGKGYKNMLPYDSHVHYLSAKGVSMSQPIFKGKKLDHNPYELTLYVPSTLGESVRISPEQHLQRIKEAEQEMSKLFKGYTEVDATGGWVNSRDELKQEPEGKVTAFTDKWHLEHGRAGFEDYVRKIKKDYKQTQISIEYEGDLFFYPAEKKK